MLFIEQGGAMFGISGFRSDEARAKYHRLYDAALATTRVALTESDIETSFGRTHVVHAGDRSKPPLVALHGSSLTSTMWIPFLPMLTSSHSVTMIDAVDEVGKSVLTKSTTKSADLVAWLDETLGALDIKRAAFVAASRGTWITTHYATAFPERVERIAMVCPVGIVGGLSPRLLFNVLKTISGGPTEERVQALMDSMAMPSKLQELRQMPWQPIMQQFIGGTLFFKASLKNPQPRPWPLPSDCDLQRIATAQIPVLAIIGKQECAHDGTKTAARFRQFLPDARIELVDEAGHLIFTDQTATVEKLIAQSLQ